MFGFVFAPRETAVLDEDLALPRPVTLADELAARGIATIPIEKVWEYQERYLRQEIRKGTAGSQAKWEVYALTEYERRFTAPRQYGTPETIPQAVRKTIGRAQTIPDSEISVERFYEDPFVFIRREEEVHCIAFWNAPGFTA